MLLNECHQRGQGNSLGVLPIDQRDDLAELEAVGLHELLPELLDGSVVLNFLFEELGQLSLAVILQEFVSGHESAADA